MIGYITLGTADMAKSRQFYLDLFAKQGAKLVTDMGRIAFIGLGKNKPMIAVCTPYDGGDPHPGNGTMAAFQMDSKAEVDAIYEHAISLGAQCDGAPGQRLPDRFYGAYVRDADGNKLCFFIFA